MKNQEGKVKQQTIKNDEIQMGKGKVYNQKLWQKSINQKTKDTVSAQRCTLTCLSQLSHLCIAPQTLGILR